MSQVQVGVHKHFRDRHILAVLARSPQIGLPMDVFLARYFRANPSIGSKDRKSISETVYRFLRWQALIDYFCPKPLSPEGRCATLAQVDPLAHIEDCSIPLHIRASFPKSFFSLLVQSLGERAAFDFCIWSNSAAPTTIRINPAKTTRCQLLARWTGRYAISACTSSPLGILFHKRENFFSFPEFRAGLFEIQDEGSQLVAALVRPVPGDQVLDLCAGSGGKTLAFAHLMRQKGQIYLHDIRPRALREAKIRLKRAGIQNAQLLLPTQLCAHTFGNKMHWVLIDAPCTGTGTLRRNPDIKWKFSLEDLTRLVVLQRTLFEQAIRFTRPGGQIVYVTCSILPEENQRQVEYFLHHHSVALAATPLNTFMLSGEMDGLFGAVFIKTSPSC